MFFFFSIKRSVFAVCCPYTTHIPKIVGEALKENFAHGPKKVRGGLAMSRPVYLPGRPGPLLRIGE